MNSLLKNNTCQLVQKPKDKKIVGCRRIFKKKDWIPGVAKQLFKVRVVAKGFTQVQGIDFNEIYSLVVKQTSVRLVLALVAQNNMELEQMDVKTGFLHGDLEETVYMQQLEGFIAKEDENKVCLLE